MKIEILGTECPKCQKLAANVKVAADKLGIRYELCRVTDLGEIMKRGVMFTPALAIDGQIKSTGKALNEENVANLLSLATKR